jgi:putative intracellular protease/amidase
MNGGTIRMRFPAVTEREGDSILVCSACCGSAIQPIGRGVKQDRIAQEALSRTIKLGDVKADDFDTVFYPGGHGPMWDLAESPVSIALLESFYNSGTATLLVCSVMSNTRASLW